MSAVLPVMMAIGATSPAMAQADFSGEWAAIAGETNATDPLRGELGGLPLNREGVRRAEIWDPEIESLPVWQCAPAAGMELRLEASHLRIWKQADGSSGELGVFWVESPGSVRFPIFMDQRPHPPVHARHSWAGYSTGAWSGEVLQIDTTHLKEGHYRGNGVPQSDRARFTELLMQRTFRGEDYLTWVVVAEDPIYLTEPLVRSGNFRRGPISEPASRCAPTKPAAGTPSTVPSFLPGAGDGPVGSIDGLPPQLAVDGAASMYPEYRAVIDAWRRSGGNGLGRERAP